MISGLPLSYATARTAARLAQRPSEALWQQWHAARGLTVLLDAVRTSAAASSVSGVGVGAGSDSIELAFRVQLRARIAEVAEWAPDEWRAALLWTQRLVDLPLAAHCAAGEKVPGWVGDDAALASVDLYEGRLPSPGASRHPLPPIRARVFLPSPASARDGPGVRVTGATTRHVADFGEAHLHPTLLAWLAHWRSLWPACSDDDRAALERLIAAVAQHLVRFGSAAPEDAAGLRADLRLRLTTVLRQHSTQAVALFAALALHALDLERLRAEFLLRAAFDDRAAR